MDLWWHKEANALLILMRWYVLYMDGTLSFANGTKRHYLRFLYKYGFIFDHIKEALPAGTILHLSHAGTNP